jgi:hypothetical protein
MSRSGIDFVNKEGTRISIQLYLDPLVCNRKRILNALRNGGAEGNLATSQSNFGSISVATPAPPTNRFEEIQRALGMTISNLRGVLLGRGGNASGLILTAARLADVSIVTKEDLKDAYYQAYLDACKFLTGEHPTSDSGGNHLEPLSITEAPRPAFDDEAGEAAA